MPVRLLLLEAFLPPLLVEGLLFFDEAAVVGLDFVDAEGVLRDDMLARVMLCFTQSLCVELLKLVASWSVD